MKKPSLLLFILGENEFSADARHGAGLLNLFMEYGIVYRGFGASDEGRVSFRCSGFASAMLLRVCRQRGIELERTCQWGLPRILRSYRRRVGLLIGALIAAALLMLYDDFVWDITVSGNESVTYSEVLTALEAHGLSVGSGISGLDVDKIKTAVMIDEDRISWMAINLEGTVARVQIREAVKPREDEPKKPANVVAARDGQIENVELFRGTVTVVSGQAVRAGEILISGIRDLKNGGFSVTRASGSVFAVTEHTFTVTVPYEYEQKNLKKAKLSEISVIFFGKEVKVLKFNGNKGEFCDTIDSVDMLSLPWGARLPLGVKRVSELPYTLTAERYSSEEAMEIAYYRLERMIAAELPEATLLSKRIDAEAGEDAYTLVCTVKCVEDIAKTVEFEADLQ